MLKTQKNPYRKHKTTLEYHLFDAHMVSKNLKLRTLEETVSISGYSLLIFLLPGFLRCNCKQYCLRCTA